MCHRRGNHRLLDVANAFDKVRPVRRRRKKEFLFPFERPVEQTAGQSVGEGDVVGGIDDGRGGQGMVQV